MRALEALAQAYGIAVTWIDARGAPQTVNDESLRVLLATMGVDAGTDARVAVALEALKAERAAPPVLVVPAKRRPVLALDPAAFEGQAFRLRLEDGKSRSGRFGPATGAGLVLPLDLPAGRHVLEVRDRRIALVACPERCLGPSDLGFDRAWGLGVQLYALRAQRNDGIGDFADAARLAGIMGKEGADFLGLNPLHALFPAAPATISPYAPSSRRFLNVLYIAVDRAAEDLGLSLPAALSPVPDGDLLDYPAVAARKRAALEHLWNGFEARVGTNDPGARAFAAYRDGQGEPLKRHALFDALQEAALAQDPDTFAFWTWPEGWRDPNEPEVEAFCRTNPSRVGFFSFLQWLADKQLGLAQEAAKGAGMRLGLYKDLAVGVNPAGATVWAQPGLTLRGVSIGAPPDIFNPKGQVWGLAPFSPAALAEAGYEPLMADLRANMRHAGAVRVDHVIGLKRQWWVPDGMDAGDGAYVRFPFEDIARLIARESHATGCLVIGEDLGTVPKGFDKAMRTSGMLSCKVFWFERKGKALRPPEAYASQALTSLSTHDLPTLRGYWTGRDIDHREGLDLFSDPGQAASERAERARERRRIVRALEQAEVVRPGEIDAAAPDATQALLAAVHRYLARTPSALLMVQIEDALLQAEQANLPGTVDEHPNWRRRVATPVEDLIEQPLVAALVAALREERPR